MPSPTPPQGPERVTLIANPAMPGEWNRRDQFGDVAHFAEAGYLIAEYVPRSLAVELAEALQTIDHMGNRGVGEIGSRDRYAMHDVATAALSKAKDVGLLGTE